MPTVLVGIGANLGNPARQLQQSVDQLAGDSDLTVQSVSQTVASPAVGGPAGQPEYLNSAVRLQTELPPEELWRRLLAMEHELGRVRERRWDARTLDLDILMYGTHIIHTRRLCIPHAWMAVRRFVMGPAAEIGGELVHPVIGLPLERVWRQLINRQGSVAIVDGWPRSATAARCIASPADELAYERLAGWRCVPAPTVDAAVEYGGPPSDTDGFRIARPPIWLLEATARPATADGSIRGYIIIAPPVSDPVTSDAATLRRVIGGGAAPAVLIRPSSHVEKIRLVRAALDGMQAISLPRVRHIG